ncbi:hypothetical protein OAF37_03455 [Rubripirellula sp.]|nr:hypothetical protein [Rubripirellula sp.]MDB4645094.1 hypothetical protein [Rubripirellula sp.]
MPPVGGGAITTDLSVVYVWRVESGVIQDSVEAWGWFTVAAVNGMEKFRSRYEFKWKLNLGCVAKRMELLLN